jgi:peptidoglycan/LPS O-acetylase OafA/YrhL
MIPYPVVRERYFNLFHLNPPTWTLFWEYIANIAYAVILIKLRNKMLWALTAIAAAALCYEAYRSGFIGVGFGGDNIIGGGIRMFYPFLAGMLIYRSNWVIKNKLGFAGTGILLSLVFFIPFLAKGNWITDSLVVVLYLPLLVSLGAGAQLSPALSKVCKFSGDISYPLYMVHYPFIWIFCSYVETKKPALGEMAVITVAGVVLLTAFAYWVMIYLDIPIRRYLKNTMKERALATKKASL